MRASRDLYLHSGRAYESLCPRVGTNAGGIHMRKVGLMIVGALALTAVTAGLATAKGPHGKSTCTGTLASGKYHRLVVPAGATCNGTQANIDVRGGVRVGEGATFVLGHDGGTDTGRISGG